MTKIYKSLLAVLIAVMFATSQVLAGGVTVGVIGNLATFDTDGSETEGGLHISGGPIVSDMEVTKKSVSEDVEFPSFFVEFNSDLMMDHLGLNIGFEYIPGATELGAQSRTDANTISTDDGTYTAKAEAEHYMSVYVEPTLMFNENIGVYGKAAISRITIKSLESIDNGGDSSAYGDKGILGGTIGVGLRGQLGFFVAKLEAAKTEYESISLRSTSGNRNLITADTEQEAVRLSLGLNF